MEFVSSLKRILRIVFFPIIWLFTSSPLEERLVEAFADWFGGVPAFKQQTLIILLWLISILTGWIHDPDMLHFMMALTIYSAITQPMLAIGNAVSNRKQARQDEKTMHVQEAMKSMMDVIIALANRLDKKTDAIADDVDEIAEELKGERNDDDS